MLNADLLRGALAASRQSATAAACNVERMERETGIGPATNSLEGCDSTTELLPPYGTTCRTQTYGADGEA